MRIQAINTYLKYLKKEHLRLSLLKLQQKNFLENVISEADYEYFKKDFSSMLFNNHVNLRNQSII